MLAAPTAAGDRISGGVPQVPVLRAGQRRAGPRIGLGAGAVGAGGACSWGAGHAGSSPALWAGCGVAQTAFGLVVSTGFLVAARRRAAVLLVPFMVWVWELLGNAGLLHVDETPVRVGGELAYVYVACN